MATGAQVSRQPVPGASLGRPFVLQLRRRLLTFATVTIAGCSAIAAPAYAEVAVSSEAGVIRLKAENESLGQVLEALNRNGVLRYRSAAPLNKLVDGSFSGTLGEVLGRILSGFDFATIHKSRTVEVIVYGESGAKAILPQPVENPSAPLSLQTQRAPLAQRRQVGVSRAPIRPTPKAPTQYDKATSKLYRR